MNYIIDSWALLRYSNVKNVTKIVLQTKTASGVFNKLPI